MRIPEYFITLTVCSDIPVTADSNYQYRCMQNAVVDFPSSNVCDVNGIQCSDGMVREICWDKHTLIRIKSLDWFPRTTVTITISGKSVDRILHIRRFPKDLQNFHAADCRISGRADLYALPDEMVNLDLYGNRCTGKVDLTNLPPTISTIDLAYNQLSSLVVCNSKLPSNLLSVRLRGNPNLIKIIILDNKRPDARIDIKHK